MAYRTKQPIPAGGKTIAEKSENALDVLRKKANQATRLRHPSLPQHALPKAKFSDRTTNGLTNAVITYIRLLGGQAERISVEGRVIDRRKTFVDVIGRSRTVGSVQRIRSSAQVGSADIAATINGRSVKIEVKKGSDRQRKAQREYQRQVEGAGGVYLLVSNFQQFYDWYEAFIGAEKRLLV
ncbi:hypothetical protein GCM10027275_30840 [Rhabdobacter roseus]